MAECAPLIRLATADLYRGNLFRLTGLPVDTSEREIKRHADKMRMMEELGQGAGGGSAAFSLNPPPSSEDIRESMRHLTDPERRLLDEFFWFWPRQSGQGSVDPAIHAIAAGDTDSASDMWTDWEDDPSIHHIASHNLAVMFHFSALEWTALELEGNLSGDEIRKAEGCWKECLHHWKRVVDDERIWEILRLRVHEFDDPRLTISFVQRMRRSLFTGINKINAEIAINFAERGDFASAGIHVALSRCGENPSASERAAELALTVIGNRVAQHLSSARSARRNGSEGTEAARTLFTGCRPLLEIFLLFHPPGAIQVNAVFHEVADLGNTLLVTSHGQTRDDATFLILLRECLAFAFSPEIRPYVTGNIKYAEHRLESTLLAPFIAKLNQIRDGGAPAKVWLQSFQKTVMPLLFEISASEDGRGLLTEMFADILANTLADFSEMAYNSHHNGVAAYESLLLAAKLATKPETKEQMALKLEDIAKMLGYHRCHFCGNNRPHAPSVACAIMEHGANRMEIPVPRCHPCMVLQHNQRNLGCSASVLALAICSFTFQLMGLGLFPSLVVGGALGFLAGRLIPLVRRGGPKLRAITDYPKVRHLLSQRWTFTNAG